MAVRIKHRYVFVFFVLLLAVALVVSSQIPRARNRAADAAAERWAERTLAAMSLEEKLGQLLMVFYYGGFTSTESDEYRELVRQIERNHVGGVALSTRPSPAGTQLSQAYPAAVLSNQLQRAARYPLLVAADFERGTAMRLAEGTSFPYAMAVAATGRPEDAATMARISAAEARAVGVHWIFAPVADVNVNPQNPIINTRAFGEDPEQVSAFVAAFVAAAEEGGVLTTAKHFPGHGDTATDTHVDLSRITADRARLDRVELAPFRAAIAAGASTIMTGHLAVPALDPDPELPATMSARILTDVLRGEMGFEGIIVTDALGMGGVTTRYSPGEVAVRSILAGADVLLVPPVTDAALLALREAVGSGRLPMARVDESALRILRAKARLGLHEAREVELDALNRTFGRPEYRAAAEAIADRGVTLVRNADSLVPLDATRRQRVLLVAVSADPDALPAAALEAELRARAEEVRVVRTDTRWVPVEKVALPPTTSWDVAVVAVFVRVADRKGTVGLPAGQAALVNRVLAAGRPAVVAAFGSPYLVERFPQARNWIASFSTFDVNQRAVARALFGQTEIAGQMPVTVPGVAKRGEGIKLPARPMELLPADNAMLERFAAAFAAVERATQAGTMRGALLAVGHRSRLAQRTFGRVDPAAADALGRRVAATLGLAALVERRLVDIDAPVSRYLPEWNAGPQPAWRARATVRHLLLDAAGLPATMDVLPAAADPVARALAAPLAAEPGARVAPSEAGSLLVGEIVRRVSGRPAVEFAADRFGYTLAEQLPLEDAPAAGDGAAAAGAFPPVLSEKAQMLLNGGIYRHRRALRRATVELFTGRMAVAGEARALGWEVGPWSGGPLSRRAFGAEAAGAWLWVDPEREVFIVFIRSGAAEGAGERLAALRASLFQAVAAALPR